jgi:hypothetical protein
MKGGNFDTIFKSKFKQWKPKDGKNRIRILPPTWKGAKHYGYDIFVNYNIGPDNQSYLSLSKHNLGADPIAEARREAQADGDKDFAKKLNPNQRILYWIIDRSDEDEGPLLWAAPFTFDKALSNLCIDEDTKDVMFIDDPKTGRDVRFYKEGTGLLTKYDPSKMKVLPEGPTHDDADIEQDWLDFVADNPLPEVLNFYNYDHINAAFAGQAGRDNDEDEGEGKSNTKRKRADADDDADEKPRSRQQSRRSDPEDEDEKPKARSRKAEPDEDEDEKPVRGPRRDADDDEIEKPSRARQRSKSSDDDDAEDEDEKPKSSKAARRAPADDDDDTDQEDEKPARRSRVSRDVEDEDPPSTRRTKSSSADDEEGGGSLRERLARRRSRSSDDD